MTANNHDKAAKLSLLILPIVMQELHQLELDIKANGEHKTVDNHSLTWTHASSTQQIPQHNSVWFYKTLYQNYWIFA